MRTRNRLVLAPLALDAGRWWTADWARERVRCGVGVVAERCCWARQAVECRYEESWSRHPMEEANAMAREEIEWAFFVAAHRADGVWRDGALR
ncbi:hypothetical protein [Streptomyces sp. NBC_00236]|uniref:hypothetical protein n=1 Tax=Streptomyces sp. NBC_00236 TaxID=2903639 RepID=UPI002E2940A6|nr:hypothetical protein [Streptomyces sp. NBC_00236]